MTKTNAQRVGVAAEQQAAAFLQSRGLTLIARNVLYRCGELDLVMQDQELIVFIEVRLRSKSAFATAAASVGLKKQRRIQAAAQLWLAKNFGNAWPPCRFDVFAITGGSPAWIQNAF